MIEVQNRPNVRELILSPKGGSKDTGVIKAPGSMKEIWGPVRVNPQDANGSYFANPAALSTEYFIFIIQVE